MAFTKDINPPTEVMSIARDNGRKMKGIKQIGDQKTKTKGEKIEEGRYLGLDSFRWRRITTHQLKSPDAKTQKK